MGKMLTQQRRGKGSPAFTAPSRHFFADVAYPQVLPAGVGQVISLHDDPGRMPLVANIHFPDGRSLYTLAAESLCIGDKVAIGDAPSSTIGSIKPLGMVADSTPVFNVEKHPGDGGRFARASGAAAFVISHDEETGMVSLRLASKKVVELSPSCRATLGVASGGGRLEKPMEKAGTHHYAALARGHRFPDVRGTAMNAYNHPHGGRSFGKSTTVSRNAPPGRKVGQVSARSTGRKKSKARASSGNA